MAAAASAWLTGPASPCQEGPVQGAGTSLVLTQHPAQLLCGSESRLPSGSDKFTGPLWRALERPLSPSSAPVRCPDRHPRGGQTGWKGAGGGRLGKCKRADTSRLLRSEWPMPAALLSVCCVFPTNCMKIKRGSFFLFPKLYCILRNPFHSAGSWGREDQGYP